MRIQVVRAWRERHESEDMELEPGARVADVLARTTLPREGLAGYAIYGERVQGETLLAEGDRLELLEPLQADPKDSRRRRASAQADRRRRP